VDRTPAFVRSLLSESGLTLVETRFLDLNYPRHFWVAQKRAPGPSRSRRVFQGGVLPAC